VIGLLTQKQRYLIRHELPRLGMMRVVSAGSYLLMISVGAQFREPHTAFGQPSHGDRRSPACRRDVTPRRIDCFLPVPRHSIIVSNATDKIERMSVMRSAGSTTTRPKRNWWQYAGYVARRATMMELHGYQSRVNIYADDPNAFADEVRHHI
jgi:hypothetical protein